MAFSCLHSLISLLVILTYQGTAQFTPFINDCGNKDNYTANSTYQNNLNALLINLSSNTNIDYGFYNFSYGENSDTVHAIGLCRGDVKPQECRSCLNDSRVQLTSRCPNQKEAIGFSLTCMLRYSNKPIYGIMDDSEVFYQWYGNNATMVEKFNEVLVNLLKGLRSKAASGDSLRKFATGNGVGPNFQSIYALVQCTPDLSEEYCNDCLQGAISRILICCSGHRNTRIARRSCNVRFEANRFYAAVADTPPLPHAPSADSTPSKDAQGKSNTLRYVIIITVVSTVALVLLVIFICIYLRMKNPRKRSESETEEDDEIEVKEPLQFDFDTIRLATNDFSDANKLGEGGFGPVYKGMLSDGQEISRNSNQGDIEFKNEVMLLAKLQHRNLVRLFGFCLERREMLLIYEFLPNKSLNYFIFDSTRNKNLNWEKRYKIIQGIARGLLYLHEDSRLRIIHRDLKLSNILLDQEMNPKISNFGTARLFLEDQTQSHTSRIVGTYRYMAPEYVMDGHFSMKSDVFSFGVIVLEIISGRRNADDLLSFVWKNWSEGIIANIIDPSLNDGSRNEIRRCIHIGLLCVQEDKANRPTMASVIVMFNSHSVTLPIPLHPAFYIYSTSLSDRNPRENNSRPTRPSESKSNSNEASGNEASITELSPR